MDRLTIEQAAAYLKVSIRTMRRYEQKIPYLRLGGRNWFYPADLDAFVLGQMRFPQEASRKTVRKKLNHLRVKV